MENQPDNQAGAAAQPRMEASWLAVLREEFGKPYFAALKQFLVEERKVAKVYPPGSLIFNAFNKTPFDAVKVVILGQDPYHGAGQAEGLCFSVAKGIAPPPSLINIFQELRSDLNIMPPNHGSLVSWAESGVLLLNTALTVRAGQAASHRGKGWEQFTDEVIRRLSEEKEHLVFLLWGKFAHEKSVMIDSSKHLVLKAAHPSPYSASAGFFGCKHFSKANTYLRDHGIQEINWAIR